MDFGIYLRNLRKSRNWTQPEAAEHIGVEQSYLSKLETGKATPSEKILDDLVRAYDIDLDGMVRQLSAGAGTIAGMAKTKLTAILRRNSAPMPRTLSPHFREVATGMA